MHARPHARTSEPAWYVVVDELDEVGCRLTVDRWPATDADGRLVFEDGARLVSVPPDRLHAAVTAAREQQGDEVPDRALRIGDTFAWWDGDLAAALLETGSRATGPASADVPPGDLVDVTRDARAATNAAALAAGGGVLDAGDLFALDLDVPGTTGPEVAGGTDTSDGEVDR